MKFQKIEIENFASYYGKNGPFSLEVEKDKPLIIFIGQTGFGKTSMFDAINWALYGDEYEKDLLQNKERGIEDYVNEQALKEASVNGERLQISVTLYFCHEGTSRNNQSLREYYISQTLTIKPTKSGEAVKPQIVTRQTSLREITSEGDHKDIPYTKIFLDEILPNNVKSYFLFDSDRIHNLAKPGNSQQVQDAIYRVVDLEIIRNAATHLNDAAIEFGKKAAKSATGELAEVEEAYQEELQHQGKIRERLQVIKKERTSIKDQIEKIDAKLKDLPESSALQEKKNNLTARLRENEENQRKKKSSLRDAATVAAYSLVTEQLKELENLLAEKRAKGEIPKHVRETFFNDLFALKECICGTTFNIDENDAIYQALKSRQEHEKNRSNEEDRLIDLYHELIQAQDVIQTSVKEVNDVDVEIAQLEEEHKSLVYQKQEVDEQLKTLPIEDISALMQQRQTRDDRDKELFAELKTKTDQLATSESTLKEYEDRRKELGRKQDEAGAYHLRSEIAKRASDELNSKYEIFAEQSRKEVENLTISEFKNFVLSSSSYQVSLSKDYSLEVLDSNRNRALQRLSMGQSQCLSLAFITAISRVSKKNPPLVIDMPFGRLDPTVHEGISKRLPFLANQTILFLIPVVEWNDKTIGHLSNYASHIYEMSFNESVKETSITVIK